MCFLSCVIHQQTLLRLWFESDKMEGWESLQSNVVLAVTFNYSLFIVELFFVHCLILYRRSGEWDHGFPA